MTNEGQDSLRDFVMSIVTYYESHYVRVLDVYGHL